MRRSLPFIALILVMLGLAIPATAGGGTSLESPKRTHQPGDVVTLVGYTHTDGQWLDGDWVTGPWIGAITSHPFDAVGPGQGAPGWVEVGEAAIEDTALGGHLSYRVMLQFTLPDNMKPGRYGVIVRNAAGAVPGYLTGGSLAVGVDPEEESPWVEWPLDEPLIAELPDDAVIAGPGFEVTVAELRRGEYPPGAAQFMFDPSVLPTTTTTSTSTTSTTTTVALDPAVAEAVQVLTDLPPTSQDPGAAPQEGVAGGQVTDRHRVSVSGTSIAGMLAAAALLGGAAVWLRLRQRRQRHHPSWRP